MSCTIITLSELKSDLGITDATDDAALQRLADGLQGRFEDHCNRLFARSESAVEYHDGGTKALYPKRTPIESVSEIIIDPSYDFAAGDALDASDDYRLDPSANRVIYKGGGVWPSGPGIIKLTYTGGYVAAGTTPGSGQTAMPDALRRALLMQAAFEWRNRTTMGAASASLQGQNIQLAPAKFLPEVLDALAPLIRY